MTTEWILAGGLVALLYVIVDLRRTNKKLDVLWDALVVYEDDGDD